jgi:hypothetical protein
MISTLGAHGGQSSFYFNILDEATLHDLVPNKIPGGPIHM